MGFKAEKAWLPLLVTVVLLFFILNVLYTVTGQYSLRRCCLDLGFEPTCGEDAALKAASQFSLISLGATGVILLVTVGFVSALSNRLGRFWTIVLSTSGQGFIALTWFIIFLFPEQVGPNWKIIALMGSIVASTFGGVLILYMGIFGMISDISAKRPSLRTLLYVLFDILVGLAGVAGAQTSAQLMKYHEKYLTGFVITGTVSIMIFAFFTLPETLPDETRRQPIDRKKANIFRQMMFLLPIQSSNEILHQDHNRIYERISYLYQQQQNQQILSEHQSQGAVSTDPMTPQPFSHADSLALEKTLEKNDYPIFTEDDAMTRGVAAEATVVGLNNPPIAFDELEYANGITNTVMHESPALSPNASQNGNHGLFDQLRLDGDNPINSDLIVENRVSGEDRGAPKIPKLQLSAPPRLIPQRWSLLTLTLTLFFNVLTLIGQKVVELYFLKKKFHISSQEFSNLQTISAIVRGLGSFVFFPVMKKFFKTPTSEKYLLIACCWIQAVAFAITPFCNNFFQFCCISIVGFLAATFPSGIVRSLMSNQVSEQLQTHVLAAIAAFEVWIFVFGGVGFNLIWMNTGDTSPGLIYFVFCGVITFAGFLPIFDTESAADLNLRVEMTTQFTKIRSAEKEYENYQAEQKGKYGLGGLGFGGYDGQESGGLNPTSNDSLHSPLLLPRQTNSINSRSSFSHSTRLDDESLFSEPI